MTFRVPRKALFRVDARPARVAARADARGTLEEIVFNPTRARARRARGVSVARVDVCGRELRTWGRARARDEDEDEETMEISRNRLTPYLDHRAIILRRELVHARVRGLLSLDRSADDAQNVVVRRARAHGVSQAHL